MLFHLSLLLPCAACLFGVSRLAIHYREESLSQRVLMWFLLFVSIFFFIEANYVSSSHNYKLMFFLDIWDDLTTLSLFPFLYLYFKALTHPAGFNWKDSLWFLPAAIVGIGGVVPYAFMDPDDAQLYVGSLFESDGYVLAPPFSRMPWCRIQYFVGVKLYSWLSIVQMMALTLYASLTVIRYHVRLRNFYSTVDDKSIDLNDRILFWALLLLVFTCIFGFASRHFWENHHMPAMFLFAAWAVPAFFISHNALKMVYSVEDFSRDVQHIKTAMRPDTFNDESAAGCDAPKGEKVNVRLRGMALCVEQLMKEKALFREATLRIDDVALMLGTNSTYVSRSINGYYNCNFSDYVARMRVEYAKQMLLDDCEANLDTVAEKSGFITSSSFYRAFKKFERTTPKEWAKQARKRASSSSPASTSI